MDQVAAVYLYIFLFLITFIYNQVTKSIPTRLRAICLFIFLLSIAFFYNQVTNKIPTRLRADQALKSRFGLITVGDYSLPARSHGFE